MTRQFIIAMDAKSFDFGEARFCDFIVTAESEEDALAKVKARVSGWAMHSFTFEFVTRQPHWLNEVIK